MTKFLEFLGTFLAALLFVAVALFGAAFLLAFPVMWLWNWVIVDIFQLPEIGYWKAFGIYILFGLLVKNVNTGKKD